VTDGCRCRLSSGTSGTIDIAATPHERGRIYTPGGCLERHRQAVAASNRAVVPFVQIRQDIDQLEGLLDVWEPA